MTLLTKKELVNDIAAKTGVEKAAIRAVLNAQVDAITEALVHGKSVRLNGLGKFESVVRKARVARNPRTGELVHTTATKTARFSVSNILKSELNK